MSRKGKRGGKRKRKHKRQITRAVPCDGCTVCCQWEPVQLHPEEGDRASQYHTRVYRGHHALIQSTAGDCIYLDPDAGCTIYDRRPSSCRAFDCAVVALGPGLLCAFGATLTPELLDAGRRRMARAPGGVVRLADGMEINARGEVRLQEHEALEEHRVSGEEIP